MTSKTVPANMTRTLGTVLPTAESLARGDAHAARIATEQKRVGSALPGCSAVTVRGEVRYYKNSKTYALVSRGLAVRWFDVRADGDYPVRR